MLPLPFSNSFFDTFFYSYEAVIFKIIIHVRCELLHFVSSYMNQNKRRKQTLENAQYGLEIVFDV